MTFFVFSKALCGVVAAWDCDPVTPYRGARTWVAPEPLPSITTWTVNRARRNRCGTNPVESVVDADIARLEYTNCADDATVAHYTVKGGGHSWPGGEPMPEWLVGSTSNGVDATSQLWACFREHRLREAHAAARHN